MKTLRLAILTSLIAVANFCIAQTSLRINDSTLTIGNDTLTMNSTPTVYFEIDNASPVLGYTGNITVEIYNDSAGTGGFGNLIPVDSIYLQNTTINAASSFVASDSFLVSPSAFRSGINTVVIWPRTQSTSGFTTSDSTRHSVYVILKQLLNKELLFTDKIIIYPNPFTSKISFIGLLKNNIEQVRVLDVLGKEVLSMQLTEKAPLDLSYLDKGIYFIKLQSKEGKQIIIKTIKE